MEIDDFEDAPCGHPDHTRGHWENDVLGIWWCPDCGEEIYFGVID